MTRKEFSLDWATEAHAEALVPLLAALGAHDVPDAPSSSEEDLLAHAQLLLSEQMPHRLLLAWDADGAALGLAAAAQFVSVSDPRPEHWLQMELKELFVLP